MSSSTTQKKVQENGANTEADAVISSFQRELQKKIRNKQKKLEKITDLEKKVKKKEIVANEEQLQKISSKDTIEAEIAEVKTYVDLYAASQNENAEREKKLAKQHAKEVQNVRKATVTTIANMITMTAFLENGQTVPEDIEEGVRHFSECINKLQARVQGQVQWRQERDSFINYWTKLASGSHDSVPHTDTSFEDLYTAVSEQISSGSYPEVLTGSAKPKSGRQRKPKQYKEKSEQPVEEQADVKETQPEVVEEPKPEVVEEIKPEVVEEEAKVEASVEEENTPAVEETPATEDSLPQVQETTAVVTEAEPAKIEGEEEQKEEGRSEAQVKRGEGRQRGERGARRPRGENRGRGEWRGDRGRGEWRGRGDRGRGEYRGRGNRGTRGRGGYNRNGEDDDGFTIVRNANEETRGRGRGRGEFRGRGRGGRGDRGGEHRGASEIGTRGGQREPEQVNITGTQPATTE